MVIALLIQGNYNVKSKLMVEVSGLLGCDVVLLLEWFQMSQDATDPTAQHHIQKHLNIRTLNHVL
jgi:hypothetical protein